MIGNRASERVCEGLLKPVGVPLSFAITPRQVGGSDSIFERGAIPHVAPSRLNAPRRVGGFQSRYSLGRGTAYAGLSCLVGVTSRQGLVASLQKKLGTG